MKRIMVVVVAGVLLCGCKLQVTPELYVSDLKEVASGGVETLPATTMMSVPIPSVDSCQEYTESVLAVLSEFLSGAKPKGCEREGMESYLRIEFIAPIVPDHEAWQRSRSLLGVVSVAQDEGVGVALMLDLVQYETVTERMSREFPLGSMELSDARIGASVVNDLRELQTLAIWDVFVDGEPVAAYATFEVERRRTAEITVSNVRAAYLARRGQADLLFLTTDAE